jgi:hypothetical protein
MINPDDYAKGRTEHRLANGQRAALEIERTPTSRQQLADAQSGRSDEADHYRPAGL